VIAVGVMLIAYGLLGPRTAVADSLPIARPMFASDRVDLPADPNGGVAPFQLRCEQGQRAIVRQLAGGASAECVDDRPGSSVRGIAQPVSDVRTQPAYETYRAPTRQRTTSTLEPRTAKRDWSKTAMVIGGSTAAGAGLGAIFGGKKGALIGAALGGGAGTIYEVRKR
jgi:hypothetical protein